MSSTTFTQFKELLAANNCFATKPRQRLFEVLQQNAALTFKQLAALANDCDQATIYRNVDLFERLGIITRVRLGWNTKIELSDLFKHHHHHLSCLSCGKVIDLPEDTIIENQIGALTRKYCFQPTDHQLEIRGYCQYCKLAQA